MFFWKKKRKTSLNYLDFCFAQLKFLMTPNFLNSMNSKIKNLRLLWGTWPDFGLSLRSIYFHLV